jgi:hypothetical protein
VKRNSVGPSLRETILAVGLTVLFLTAAGCNSAPPQKAEQETTPAGAPAQNPADPGIDLNCILDRIRNPADAFHYSYSWHGQSASVTQEVDVTPQILDGTVKSTRNGQANDPEPVHATRADSDGWRMQGNHLAMGIGFAGIFVPVDHSLYVRVREGAEKVNGYDTIRYSIDTARFSAADQASYDKMMGPGYFLKGTVWVNGPGCPVKLFLDTGTRANDGTISKDHYEEAMVKK